MSLTQAELEGQRRRRAANPEREREQNRQNAKLFRSRHPERLKEYARKHREKNPGYHRKRHLQRYYDMTIEQYDAMVKEQDGKCRTCGTEPKRLFVDHDHKTGKVRGLLCSKCNTALGYANDDPALLRRLAEYLEGK